jgi:hypothetical protein
MGCKRIDVHANDTIWIDAKGVAHTIANMDIAYVEACLRFLNKHGVNKDNMPKALFERYAQRHEVIANEFEELG